MISRASGSLTAIRTLFSGKEARVGAARRFLFSSLVIRWGALALVIGGFAGAFASLLEGRVMVRDILAGPYTQPEKPGWMLSEALRGSGMLLIALGLLGLYVASPKRTRWLGRLAAAGALLAVPLGIVLGAAHLHRVLFVSVYYGPWGILGAFSLGEYFVQPVGVLLLGVAALWIRGLGVWRVVPLIVGLLSSPLPYVVLFYLLFVVGGIERESVYGPGRKRAIMEAGLFAGPAVLAGLGYVLLGFAMFGLEKREAALLAKEQRATEGDNLRKAHRLYDRALGAGDLPVVDELAAPDLLDHRGGHRGPENFKRAITDLRRAFPDLRLTIEEQTAQDDTVMTLCSLSGTDRGGVLWYPPTNRRATFSASYTDRFANGKLVEHDGNSDTEGLLAQLGLSNGDG